MSLKIGVLPVTNEIVIGSVKNNLWQKNRTVVTDDALYAVFEHLLKRKEDIIYGGKYRLSIEEIQ